MKILVVEDNVKLAEVLRRGLAENGHTVEVRYDGQAAIGAATTTDFDAIVLDVMLPKRDGLSVVRECRARSVRTPVLMLTSRDTVADTVAGLDAGADDYLRKPFVFAELEARLRSIVRRNPVQSHSELRAGDIVLNLATRHVSRGETKIALTARETAFLEFFMLNAGLLVTRRMIEDALWEPGRDTESNVIEVFVRRLRAKLSPGGEPSVIATVRGAGYRFEPVA